MRIKEKKLFKTHSKQKNISNVIICKFAMFGDVCRISLFEIKQQLVSSVILKTEMDKNNHFC